MRRVLLRFKFPFFGGCGKKSNQSLLIARTRFHDPLLDSYTETMQTKKKSKQGETVKKGVPSSLLVHLCHLFPCYFGSEGIDSNFDFRAICSPSDCPPKLCTCGSIGAIPLEIPV